MVTNDALKKQNNIIPGSSCAKLHIPYCYTSPCILPCSAHPCMKHTAVCQSCREERRRREGRGRREGVRRGGEGRGGEEEREGKWIICDKIRHEANDHISYHSLAEASLLNMCSSCVSGSGRELSPSLFWSATVIFLSSACRTETR